MMTSRLDRLHNAERRPSAHMCAAWSGLILGSSPANFTSGKLGQQTSIVDSRYIRH